VSAASRIELCMARWAARAPLHVFQDRQLYATGAAEDCFSGPLIVWPDLDLMIGEHCMAILTRIVDVTALRLDRNDVGWSAIMFATGMRIQVDAVYIWGIRSHRVSEET
jgi:hypothetical protein